MDIARTRSAFATIQHALNVITLLQLTSHRYPLPAEIKNGTSFDFIIIGAGAAGCVLANRLTEDPNTSVLLIEAGEDPPLESLLPGLSTYTYDSPIDWMYKSAQQTYQCRKDNQITIRKGKALGGSGSINLMLYVRGDPHDYNTWARITNDDSWNYENVLKYFIKSEKQTDPKILNSPTSNFHGTNGYLGVSSINRNELENILDALKEMGHRVRVDTNSNNTLGYNQAQVTIDDGIRQSTANNYLSDAKNRTNLFVLKNHLATKINFRQRCKDKVAESVDVIDNEGQKRTFKAKKEIIVSAGAINSPQLLMLSGIGPRNQLQQLDINVIADLSVGENMHEHKCTISVYSMDNLQPSKPPDPRKHATPIVFGFGALNKEQTYPDYQTVVFYLTDKQFLHMCSITYAYDDDVCQSFYNRTKGKNVAVVAQIIMQPKSKSRVLLKSKDPKEYPLIYTDAYANEIDLENQIKFNQEMASLINTTYFESVGAKFLELDKCRDLGVGSKEYWRCHSPCLFAPTFHECGTCAMGSVVDSRLLVRRVKKLRVVDSSVMPTITSGNTYAPTIMIAEKASDMIKKDNNLS